MVADLTVPCQYCGRRFQAKQGRARYCGAPCRWAAWKRAREEAARAPLERALLGLAGRAEALVEQERAALEGRRAVLADLEAALQEAREALRGEGPEAAQTPF